MAGMKYRILHLKKDLPAHAGCMGYEERTMSRVLELSDEEYARLEQAAQQQGSTIAELVRA